MEEHAPDPPASDEPAEPEEPTESADSEEVAPVRPVDRFRRTATGSIVAAGLLGLRDALEGRPERDEVTIVNEAPTAPTDRPLEVTIDPDHPERTIAVVRKPPPE